MQLVKKLWEMAQNRHFGSSRIDIAVTLAAYLLPLSGVLHPKLFAVSALIYLPIICYVAFSDGLYTLYPLFFFFYSQLVAPGGIVVYRIYTVVFIMRFLCILIARRPERLCIPGIALTVFMLITAIRYAICGDIGFGAAIDLIFMLCLTVEFFQNSQRLLGMLKGFVFAALIACAVGIFLKAPGGEGRFLATLNDPNYLSFYLNIGIFTAFFHPFFKKMLIRVPVLIGLYAALIASESITGIACNLLIICVVLALYIRKGRMRARYLIIPTAVGVVGIQVVSVSQVKGWGVLTTASARLITKLNEFINGDIASFTTSRSATWRINAEKFLSLSPLEQLFGGAPSSAVGNNFLIFEQTSHQEFIDVMISTGTVGLVLFIALIAWLLIKDARALLLSSSETREVAALRFGIKLIWLFYAFGLTMFMSSRFYIPFLM